ncbi:hypothetical protein BD293_2836 [Roseinatronobacter monicus]|uniref:AAA ATPase-like protein n=1 Tax=Roseinatronobacter monicus TaxID=393481 RepID=A0A543KGG2_9RHOB|nr:hypothetical protein BD293_2836 [Roseinatronobacter monicus]
MRHETDFPIAAASPSEPTQAGFTLLRYRVSNYRSVVDSGWLDADSVTALIGVNESGKTNLLLPLWKLNPASEGALQPTSDYPKALFATIRNAPEQFQFITAEFDTGREAARLAELAKIPQAQARRVSVARLYDGSYHINFPDYRLDEDSAIATALTALRLARTDLGGMATDPLYDPACKLVDDLLDELGHAANLTGNDLRLARNCVAAMIPEDPPATSQIIPLLRALQKTLGQQMAAMIAPDPAAREEIRQAVIGCLPRFVYYSNYGNLDSESDSKLFVVFQFLARCRVTRLMCAMRIQASALAMDFSQSFDRRRHRFSQAKVRSTTHRRGSTSKPSAVSERLTIWTVHRPRAFSASRSLGPAYPPSANTCRNDG